MNVSVKTMAIATTAALFIPAVVGAQTAPAKAPVVTGVQTVSGRVISGVASKTTVGRPYSAEAVTESVQVLGDGNRIATRSLSRVYRDGEGRTRRETINASGAVQTASISDPIARTSFTLEPETKTAYSAAGMVSLAATAGGGGGGRGGAVPVEGQRIEARTPQNTVTGTVVVDGGGGRGGSFARTPAPDSPNVQREDLGQQTIEGVAATGTRITTMIPAGTIGNAQEIRIVSEQWFSPDLQVLVMTRHSDPRSGENTYKLTNILRAEPDPNYFVVPADYTVTTRRIRPQ